jgi:glutamate/aspartate transport system substrate-binding protein
MNEEKKMNMQIISAKDYGEGRVTLETGRAVAYMMDDVLLAGARSLTAKPTDWAIVGTPQSSEAYGFMLRKDDPEFRKLVDDVMIHEMKSGDIKSTYDKWFMKPVPPKGINFDFPMSEGLEKLYAAPNDKAFD